MKFHVFCEALEKIEGLSSRIAMTDLLANLYSKASPAESAIISYLVIGRVAPGYVPAEFNVADKAVVKVLEAVLRLAGRRASAKAMYDKLGDLGLAAQEVLGMAGEKKSANFTIEEVYGRLWEVVLAGGTGSQTVRAQKIQDLMLNSTPLSAKFIVRILLQKLRLGCSSKTVLDALSLVRKGSKEDREVIEGAHGICSDLGYVAAVYLAGGRGGLEAMKVIPGVPIASMLVEREKDADSIMKRIPDAIVQPKFDGLRCQIHIGVGKSESLKDRVWWKHWDGRQKDSGQHGLFGASEKKAENPVRLFSRNLEDITDMFPEIVEAAGGLKVESAVFDSEVIGFRQESSEFVKFQETMTRKRKYEVSSAVANVPVRAFVFDVLYLNGRQLLAECNRKRVDMVEDIIGKEGDIVASSNWRVLSASKLQDVFEENISAGLEGVIIKDPNTNYKPGRRGFDWLKMKRAFQGHLADSLDVVILGYYFGRGKRVGLGVGALLSAVYDSERDAFVTIAKIGTGITDEILREIRKDLDAVKLAGVPKRVEVSKALVPDQWVEPVIVATVEADEITKSPIHTAGAGKNVPGFALRFPRLKGWNRDKLPTDATTVAEVEGMYKRQG